MSQDQEWGRHVVALWNQDVQNYRADCKESQHAYGEEWAKEGVILDLKYRFSDAPPVFRVVDDLAEFTDEQLAFLLQKFQ